MSKMSELDLTIREWTARELARGASPSLIALAADNLWPGIGASAIVREVAAGARWTIEITRDGLPVECWGAMEREAAERAVEAGNAEIARAGFTDLSLSVVLWSLDR